MINYLLTKNDEVKAIVQEGTFCYHVVDLTDVKHVQCYYDVYGSEVTPRKGTEHNYSMSFKEEVDLFAPREFIDYDDVKVVDTNLEVINRYKGK